jgi:hypothetical protein
MDVLARNQDVKSAKHTRYVIDTIGRLILCLAAAKMLMTEANSGCEVDGRGVLNV